jgi:DNA-binding NarL/FixJ family response regulator
MKYLIVDDHAPTRRTLRDLLATAEDDVREASDGSQAALAYEEQQPDWVIMDIQMQPVGGLAATRAITARHPGARIVIFTQHDDTDLRSSAREAGALSYVLKDNLLELHALIRTTPV